MIRANVRVNGIVQGVGFRPFIHKQITEYELLGWIRNTSDGAEIELEGTEEHIDCFLSDLWTRAPKLAVIESVDFDKFQDLKGYTDFRIIESKALDHRNTLISPDVCICEDCLAELRDPENKRYRYPFINCTNCGPRFTIIKDVPYDRPKTTMGKFSMCPDCEREYKTITDRRYHAQPTCCSDCGPHLIWKGEDGIEVLAKDAQEDTVLVRKVQAYLKAGKIVAIKGLGGIHLACSFEDSQVPLTLRRRKHRDEKPFAIMCRDMDVVRRLCIVSPEEEKILTGFRRPIVLLRKKEKGSLLQISENGYVGIMLPYTPLHYLIFDEEGGIESLVMTSANLSDKPIMFQNQEAYGELSSIADGFLLNNRDIHVRCDDSLLWVYGGFEYLARRSRGYVPFPVIMKGELKPILACGAEQKASFCLSKGNYVFPSQHIGDLKNLETLENYENQIGHFENLFDMKPQALACDLHPDYMSTEYAQNRAEEEDLPLLQVQHHYAHMASCMADNNLDEPVIGVVWDGTGYGTDGTIWGGEFLVGDYSGFQRAGHIEAIRLPGGDRVTKELDRIAVSLLKDNGFGDVLLNRKNITADSERAKDAVEISESEKRSAVKDDKAASVSQILCFENAATVSQVLDMNINCPKATSMGRLFDGVCAILGIKHLASYEGQGAVLLEAAAKEGVDRVYPYEIAADESGVYVFTYEKMLAAMLSDRKDGVSSGNCAAAFMNTMVAMALELCRKISKDTGINKVVLSGGTFQNQYMLTRLMDALAACGLEPYCHHRVSCNDEGLSLGQLMIANKHL